MSVWIPTALVQTDDISSDFVDDVFFFHRSFWRQRLKKIHEIVKLSFEIENSKRLIWSSGKWKQRENYTKHVLSVVNCGIEQLVNADVSINVHVQFNSKSKQIVAEITAK